MMRFLNRGQFICFFRLNFPSLPAAPPMSLLPLLNSAGKYVLWSNTAVIQPPTVRVMKYPMSNVSVLPLILSDPCRYSEFTWMLSLLHSLTISKMY